MVMGEGPARDEVKHGYPFAGVSGAELDIQYLPLAGLDRSQVHVTNASRCPFPGFRNPTVEEARECSRTHLGEELNAVRPEVVVTLGVVAAQMFTYPEMGRPLDMEMHHGIPQWGEYETWAGWVVPIYHPAAGMRQSRIASMIREDFKLLGKLLPGLVSKRYQPPRDPHPEPDYRVIEDVADLSDTLIEPYGDYDLGPAIDTEDDGRYPALDPAPFSLQYSIRPGTGYMVMASNTHVLREIREWLHDRVPRPHTLYHNAPHDLAVLGRMGITAAAGLPFTDTMGMAYRLGVQQGLKALAYRHCAMSMVAFEDVVLPASQKALMEYVARVLSEIQSEHMHDHYIKSGKRKGEKEPRWNDDHSTISRAAYSRFNALLRDYTAHKFPPTDKAPWDRMDEWDATHLRVAEYCVGTPVPYPSIHWVPRHLAVWYACRDADATLRVYPELRSLCSQMSQTLKGEQE
jgi:uracil-DNA glycosylase family 4